jgi:hypothetical protein
MDVEEEYRDNGIHNYIFSCPVHQDASVSLQRIKFTASYT